MMSGENKKRYSAVVGHDGKAYVGVNVEDDINTLEDFDDGNSSKPKFVDRWWSSDYNGKKHIKRSRLEETVYFHLTTENIPIGTEIEFQLFDYDAIYFFILLTGDYDSIDPDDKKFNGEEFYKKGVVRKENDKGLITLELELSLDWEKDLADDGGPFMDNALDLYWKWSYDGKKWDSEDTICKVFFSERTLYVKPMNEAVSPMPEIYDRTGKLILFAFGQSKGKIECFVAIKFELKTRIKKISFLEELNSIKSETFFETLNILEGTKEIEILNSKVEISDFKIKGSAIFEEKLSVEFNTVKRAKQLSEYMNIYDAWGILKTGGDKVLKVLDFINITQDIYDMLPQDGGMYLNIPKPSTVVGFIEGALALGGGSFSTAHLAKFAPIGLLLMVSEWLVQDLKAKSDEQLVESMVEHIERAKAGGLDAVRRVIFVYKNGEKHLNNEEKLFTWDLMSVSNESLSKLLKGEFKTFDELVKFNSSTEYESESIELLFRYFYDKYKRAYMYIIETIFIDE